MFAPLQLEPPKTVCVFLPNWIGDVVMATPTLRALRQRFPAPTRLIGVMRPYVSQVLSGAPWLDEQIFYDRHSGQPELTPKAAAKRLREQRPDLAVLLTNSLFSALIAWRSGARRRIGFARNFRGLLLTDRLDAPRDGRRWRPWSAVDQYLTLAQAAGCEALEQRVELSTLPSDEAGAEQAWSNLGLAGKRVILVNTGSATASARMWPAEHVEELCRRLSLDPDVAVLLLCGPAERDHVDSIARRVAHPRVVTMAGQDLGLSVSKAVIRRGNALITTDSGPRHIAAAFGVPTVTLFGPTIPTWSVNYSPVELWLSRDMACRPCGRKTCPLGHNNCTRDLSVDQVLAAVQRLLHSSSQRAVA